MLAGYLAVLLTVLQLVWAQNVTTTIVTRIPVSTLTTSVTSSGSIFVVPTTVLSTRTIVSVISTATASATSTPTPTPSPIVLDTKVDAPWAVLGALLILTGIPSAFWGHKNRWSSFFIIGFYTLSLVCLALILRFGVLQAINPPSQTLRGLFVLSCSVAGFVGGGFAIFFWKGTKYFIGAWGGFAVGLFIQCMNDGGVIKPLGFRWILYSGCAVIGFVLCTIPKIHYHVLLASTAIVGASAFMLGVDCFTTAGLKEFYVYNLGFRALFPKYAYIDFPVSQTMQIELGMIGAVAIMGASVQARILIALQARLREINLEQDRRNAAIEAKAVARFTQVEKELEEWELAHGKNGGRKPKNPDDLEASRTQTPDTPRQSSQFSLFRNIKTAKGQSSVTMADLPQTQQAPKEERPVSPKLDLDLGKSVEEALPEKMLATDALETRLSEEEKKDPELQKNIQLLQEIRGIRNTISMMRSDVASPKSTAFPLVADTDRRSPTFSDASHHARISNTVGTGSRPQPPVSTARPNSTPALNEWDDYVKNRVLFQPPSGTSAPISPPATQRNRPHSITLPSAVAQAVDQRQRQERAYEFGGPDAYFEAANGNSSHGPRPASASLATFLNIPGIPRDDDDDPLAHRRRTSSGAKAMTQPRSRTTSQIVILPPTSSPAKAPEQPVVKTFEQLSARHREKMRELQAPLSQREVEQAAINSARQRWERSQAVERGVMTRKEQENAYPRQDPEQKPHARSRSTFGLNERPTSTAKVQDWQRHQDSSRQQQQQQQQQQQRSPRVDEDRARNVSDAKPRSRSPMPFPSQRPRSQLY